MSNEYEDIEVKRENPVLRILKWVLSIILVILLIFLLVWFVKRNLPTDNNSGLNPLLNQIFTENLNLMKDAAKDYYTVERVPSKEGETLKLTLKDMLELKLLLPLTDKNGKTCDVEKSYTEITKIGNEYQLKVNLSCGDEEDYIIVYMGCYNYCANYICEKEVEEKEYDPSCALKVMSGSVNSKGQFTSNVVIGFKSKNASNDAKLTNFGVGLTTNYKNSTYTITKDGTTTVYGYVKDSTGKTAVCSIKVTKVTEKVPESNPSCTLKVVSGTLGTNGSYKSDIVIGFKSLISGSNAKLTGTGIGLETNYENQTYTVTKNGTTTVYGYVKSSNGKTAVCNITVTRNNEYEYLYEKSVAAIYSDWSDWSSNKIYTSTDNIIWGKQEFIWNEKNGGKQIITSTGNKDNPIWQVVNDRVVGTYKDYVCNGYTYYRTTTGVTYQAGDWSYSNKLTNVSSIPEWTDTTKYVYRGINYAICGNTCTSKPVYVVDVYTRTVTAKTGSEAELSAKCNVSVKDVPIYGTRSVLVGYVDGISTWEYYYHTKTRTLVEKAYTSSIWSDSANDTNLIAQGYTYTGESKQK